MAQSFTRSSFAQRDGMLWVAWKQDDPLSQLAERFAYSLKVIAQVFTTSVPVHRSRRRPAKAR
jgi:hypothetical protein